MKKIYFHKKRRKWQNDFLRIKYDNFEFFPKVLINYDNQNLNFNYIDKSLSYLKSISYIRKIYDAVKFLQMTFFVGIKLKDSKKMDGAILHTFIRNRKVNYGIYIENPSSIINYDYRVNTSILSILFKKRFVSMANKKTFKGFIFYSNYSKEVFYRYYSDLIPYEFKNLGIIYPFNFNNPLLDRSKFTPKTNLSSVRLLYVSSLFSLKGGCEILEAFKILSVNHDLFLTIVTDSNTIPNNYHSIIANSGKIKLIENKLKNSELQRLYFESHILLHPTIMDSSAIVVMEALKSGLPVVASNTFAIGEYITHGINGFLIENPIKFYNNDFYLNKPIEFFGNKNAASIFDRYKQSNLYQYIVNDIVNYCDLIISDYSYYSLNAYELSMKSMFEEKNIFQQWNDLINDVII